jgi:hypothetical protein
LYAWANKRSEIRMPLPFSPLYEEKEGGIFKRICLAHLAVSVPNVLVPNTRAPLSPHGCQGIYRILIRCLFSLVQPEPKAGIEPLIYTTIRAWGVLEPAAERNKKFDRVISVFLLFVSLAAHRNVLCWPALWGNLSSPSVSQNQSKA